MLARKLRSTCNRFRIWAFEWHIYTILFLKLPLYSYLLLIKKKLQWCQPLKLVNVHFYCSIRGCWIFKYPTDISSVFEYATEHKTINEKNNVETCISNSQKNHDTTRILITSVLGRNVFSKQVTLYRSFFIHYLVNINSNGFVWLKKATIDHSWISKINEDVINN